MAKNLKINVKNTQLAEALKQFKKPSKGLEKKPASKLPPVETPVAKEETRAPAVADKEPEAKPSVTSQPAKEAAPVAEAKVAPKPPAPKEEQIVAPPRPVEPVLGPKLGPKLEPKLEPRLGPKPMPNPMQDRPLGPRPPYPPRQGGDTRPYAPRPPYPPRQGDTRPYGPRPPFRPQSQPGQGAGGYPPRQDFRPSGDRPPYPPRQGGDTRPYSPRPPYQPRPPYRPGQGTAGGYPPRQDFRSSGPGGAGGGFRRPPGAGGPSRFPPGGPPRFGATPPPREFPATKTPRQDDPTRRKLGLKDAKDKANKKPGVERTFDSRDRQGLREEDESWRSRKGRGFKMRPFQEEPIVRPKNLSVRVPITVKDLASEMKLKASQLLSNLFMKGVVLTLNDYLDDETIIQLLGHDFECEITIDTSKEKRLKITDQTIKQEITQTPPEELVLRSPVVTFMGHVDHGKTSLIDTIRKTNTAAGEAGAITQHIGAFKCHTDCGDITILDTPGHEAFSAMRSRGAEVTDIVVLVIAGDEGLRTQTIEAIDQARAAGVPIVVAINKSDKPNFNAEDVYRQLAEKELLPESWGGQTITVNCSALTGDGIKTLLEMLALQAEILELRANPNTRARGTVIESEMHKGLGAVTTVLVQNGTLRLGDAVVFADQWGKVKTMQDEYGKSVQTAPPSAPVKITGLSGLPLAGSDFIVVKDEKEAREVSEARALEKKHVASKVKRGGLDQLLEQQMQKQEKKVLPLMLRADVQGSLEALKHSLEKIISSKIEINIVSAAVGEISESDIQLAGASKATILGFHTQVEPRAESLIKELHVKVRLHDIIYHAVDDVKAIMIDLLDKIAQENDTGEVLVKAVFKSSQIGNIAGCQVSEGTVTRSNHIRIVRDNQVIWKGMVASLKRGKEDVREVSKGQECGILLQGFNDFKEGDILQAFDVSYLTAEL